MADGAFTLGAWELPALPLPDLELSALPLPALLDSTVCSVGAGACLELQPA